MGFLDEGCFLFGLLLVHALCHELPDFLTVVLVEGNVVVSDEVVAFLAGGLWCLSVSPLEPCEHRLADVYASVVDDVGLDHAVSVGLHDLCECPSQQVVADVAEVERLVGVGRGVFHHDERTIIADGLEAEPRVGLYLGEEFHPLGGADAEVEEALDGVEACDDVGKALHEAFSYLPCGLLGSFVTHLGEGEYDERELSFELRPGLSELHQLVLHGHAVELFHDSLHGLGYLCFNLHVAIHYYYIYNMRCKGTKKAREMQKEEGNFFFLLFRAHSSSTKSRYEKKLKR